MMSQQVLGDRQSESKPRYMIILLLLIIQVDVFDHCMMILTVPECTKPLLHLLLAMRHKVHYLSQITNLCEAHTCTYKTH